jgi:hypothetical protein
LHLTCLLRNREPAVKSGKLITIYIYLLDKFVRRRISVLKDTKYFLQISESEQVLSATVQIRSSFLSASIFRHMRGFALAKLAEIYTPDVKMLSDNPEKKN